MNKQSFITILLTVLMSMTGAKTFAHDIEVANSDGVTIYYRWTNNNTELAVSYRGSYSGSDSNEYSGNVVIPSSVVYNGNTYSVTSISYEAFRDCSGLTSVTIPNSVTSIGNYAFSECSGLTSVTIPNSVTSIGNYAFSGCRGLTSVTIPNSVTSIGYAAFEFCSGLTSVTIPNSVTSIVGSAFQSCSGLTSVTIPNSVTSIGKGAFAYCRGLTSVTIPNSVTSIGERAFRDCSGLTSVTIPNSVTSIGEGAFYGCSGLTSVAIPNSVTSIGDYAFRGCSGLTSVKVPVTDFSSFCQNKIISLIKDHIGIPVQLIDNEGKDITNFIVPNDVTSIGESAFTRCFGLTSVTIPNSVTSIGGSAFDRCSGLTSVTIPNSVTSIGDGAFESCSGLVTIVSEIKTPFAIGSIGSTSATLVVPAGTKASYQSTAGWNSFTKTVEVGEGGVIGSIFEIDGIRYKIGENNTASLTYANKAISGTIVIPSQVELNGKKYDVTSIGSEAFRGCSGLTSVTIPNSVTSIGGSAFSYCSGLTSVTIPNSVTYIGSEAFRNCSGLTSVTIPNSVTSIGEGAFKNCSGLTSVTIPNSVTSIGQYAFRNCSGLTSVTIGNSVTSIGNEAFRDCSGLKDVYIMRDKANINISSSAFDNMGAITLHVKDYAIESFKSTSPWKDFKKIVCDEKVTDFNLTYYVDGEVYKTETHKYDDEIIPEAVPTQKGMTFSGWSYIPKKMPGKDLSVTGSFSWSKLTKDGVVYQVYDGDNQLAKVVGKENVGENINIASPIDIDGYSFSVTTISDNVFKGCASAKSISIPATITKIGERAFANIDHLTDVTIYAKNVPETDRTAFENSYIEDYVTLHVPAGSDDIYKAVAPWKNFKSIDAIEGTKEVPAPEIIVEKGEVTFTCEEEGVTFHYEVTPLGQDAGKANKITLGQSYKIKVYASKEGCQDSEIVTKEVSIKKGDLNLDGKVDVADHVELSKIILEQGQ